MASSSPLSSITDSSFSPEDTLPQFVNIDDRYKCAVCHNILSSPVQTKCGHRLCEGCVGKLFKQGEPVTCPDADEFCEKLHSNDVTERDQIKKLLEETRKENEVLKQTVTKLETSNQDLKLKMVGQTERIIKLERRLEELPRKEQLEQHSRELTTLRERTQTLTDQIAGMEDAFTTQLAAHDRQIGMHDVRIAEMDLRFQILETASYDGVLLWKIRDYTRRKQEAVSGRTLSLYSQPFYTSKYGYKMCARIYLNGDGMGKTTHVSLFFVIMRGEYDSLLPWPFQQKVTLYLLDQGAEGRHLSDHFHPDPSSSSFRRPQTEMNIVSGCPLFVSHSVLENPTNNFLKDDIISIKVDMEESHGQEYSLRRIRE